jgi:hypothetical protein
VNPGQQIVEAMHNAAVCILAHRDIRCVVCGFDSDNIGEAVAHLRQHEAKTRSDDEEWTLAGVPS